MDDNAACSDPACGHQFWADPKLKPNWDECPKCGSKAYVKPHGQRLQDMRSLKQGWNGYDGLPPSEATIRRAEKYLDGFGAYQPKRVAPSCAGGSSFGAIGLTWRGNEGKKVYLELYDDGKDYMLFSDGYSEPMAECVTGRSPQEIARSAQAYLHGG